MKTIEEELWKEIITLWAAMLDIRWEDLDCELEQQGLKDRFYKNIELLKSPCQDKTITVTGNGATVTSAIQNAFVKFDKYDKYDKYKKGCNNEDD